MTDRPDNLNDYEEWLKRGNIKEALDALKNQVTFIVGNEQTAQMLVKQLRQEQAARDEVLGGKLEQFAFTLKTDLGRSLGTLQEQTIARLDAYGMQIDALPALVEAALSGPFGEMGRRVEALEYGYAELADKVDAALDPTTPGATLAMVALQRRVDMLSRWLIVALLLLFVTVALLGWHHYFIWERLR